MSDILVHVFAVQVLGLGGHLAIAATDLDGQNPQYVHWGPMVQDHSPQSGMGYKRVPLGLPFSVTDRLGPWKADDGSYVALSNEYIGTLWSGIVGTDSWQKVLDWSNALDASNVAYDPLGWGGYSSNSAVRYVFEDILDQDFDQLAFDQVKPFRRGPIQVRRWFPGVLSKMPKIEPICY